MALLIPLGLLLGCTEAPVSKTVDAAPTQKYEARFQIVSGVAYGIALDTKTGQLCHTYNAKIDTYVANHGDRQIYTVDHPSLDSIPLCIDLSQNETQTMKRLVAENGGSVFVKAPNGKTYEFASQAQAQEFKRSAGID